MHSEQLTLLIVWASLLLLSLLPLVFALLLSYSLYASLSNCSNLFLEAHYNGYPAIGNTEVRSITLLLAYSLYVLLSVCFHSFIEAHHNKINLLDYQ